MGVALQREQGLINQATPLPHAQRVAHAMGCGRFREFVDTFVVQVRCAARSYRTQFDAFQTASPRTRDGRRLRQGIRYTDARIPVNVAVETASTYAETGYSAEVTTVVEGSSGGGTSTWEALWIQYGFGGP